MELETINRTVSSSVVIEAISSNEMAQIKNMIDDSECVASVVSSQPTPIDSNNKKKKHRRRHKSSKISLSVCKMTAKKEKEEDCLSIQGFVGRFAVEVTESIFDLLSPKDLASCSLVCKSWRDAINSNVIWRKLCKQRGWTSTLTDWSCFQKSAHYWLGIYYTNNSDHYSILPPLCIERVCFNKYAFLIKNWKERKFTTFRIAKPLPLINFPTSGTPLALPCDGKYVVMFENPANQLFVWNLEGEPYEVDCDSCQRIDISEIRVGFDTIAIFQEPYISVYIKKGIRFELAYIKCYFVQLKNNQYPNHRITSKIFLEMNSDYLIVCSNCANVPAYIWDRLSGDNVVTVTFDLNYPILSAVNMSGLSVYFGREGVENSHKVIEFDLKQKCWTNFNFNCPQKVKQLVVSGDYICTVTSENRREFYNEVFIWNRSTGAIIKSINECGRCYQFVNNYLVYYYNSRVTVHSLEENDVFRKIYLTECITNIKLVFDHLLVLTTAEKVEVWDWMLSKKLYTAFYSFITAISIFVDCEKIVLQSDKFSEIIVLRF